MKQWLALFVTFLAFGIPPSSAKNPKTTKEKDLGPEYLRALPKGFDKEFIKANTLQEEDRYVPPPPSNPFKEANKDAKISYEKLPPKIKRKGKPKIELIVDSSGSMGQLLGGNRTKMYFSKKLITRYLIDQWREKALVGMRVYGARRKNDCSDNFLAIPFRERNLDAIEKKVAYMMPIGRTPLQKSIEEAIKDLKGHKGPKRIVIFTDGKETCGGDPCKLSKKVQANPDIDIEIYVVAIGFDPNSEEYKKVSCIGKTFPVNKEEELFTALGKISNTIKKNNNLIVKSPNPIAPVNLYRIKKNGKREYFRTFTASWGVRVPPGKYEAEVYIDPIYKFPPFTIPKGKRVILTVEGKGEVLIHFTKGLINVELLDKNSTVIHKFKSDRRFLVKTGRYKLHLYKKPYFSHIINDFLVYPKGKHEYTLGEAGVVQFDYPSLTGLYIYDMQDKLVGNYLTNVPLVLKTGAYRLFVNDNCFVKSVQFYNEGEIKHVTCQQNAHKKK
ncbi:MAG: VWA domain-containing protein [Bdellovibrio sp.]|nr:MAG: VWA domain-containing protein [Bdellovibrio sp.]